MLSQSILRHGKDQNQLNKFSKIEPCIFMQDDFSSKHYNKNCSKWHAKKVFDADCYHLQS